jgi:fructose-1-phosphate kinase PfkB-like protein
MKPILCLEGPDGMARATLAALDCPVVVRPLTLSGSEFLGALPAVEMLLLAGEGPVAELVSLAWRRAGLRSLVWSDDESVRPLLSLQPYLLLLDNAQLGRLTGRPVTTTREVLEAAQGLIETGPLVAAVALGNGDMLLASPLGAWRAVAPKDPLVPETEPSAFTLTAGTAGQLLAGLAVGLRQEMPPAGILRVAVAAATGADAHEVRVVAVR